MKKIIFIFVFLLVFVSGCFNNNGQKDNQTQNDTSLQDEMDEVIINDSEKPHIDSNINNINNQIQEPQGFATKLPKTESLTISELLEKSKKVKSYSVYPASLGTDSGIRYNYLGNRIKVELFYQKLHL